MTKKASAASSRPTDTGSQVWWAIRGVLPPLRLRSAAMRASTSAATAWASTFGRLAGCVGRPCRSRGREAARLGHPVGRHGQQRAAVLRAARVGRHPPRGVLLPVGHELEGPPGAHLGDRRPRDVDDPQRVDEPDALVVDDGAGRTTKSHSSTRASVTEEMSAQLRGEVSSAGTSRARPATAPTTPTAMLEPGRRVRRASAGRSRPSSRAPLHPRRPGPTTLSRRAGGCPRPARDRLGLPGRRCAGRPTRTSPSRIVDRLPG